MGLKDFCAIDLDLLPFKAHYFVYCGALSGATPFIPLLAKQLGIQASALGLVYFMLPFFSFLAKPFFGFLVDCFQSLKIFLISLIVLVAITLFSIVFLPHIRSVVKDDFVLGLEYRGMEQIKIHVPDTYNVSCLDLNLQLGITCSLDFKNVSTISKNYYLPCDRRFLADQNLTESRNHSSSSNSRCLDVTYRSNGIFRIAFLNDTYVSSDNRRMLEANATQLACGTEISQCSVVEMASIYDLYQFWIFTFLVIISGTASAACMSLADVACCEVLGDRMEVYGRQRLWGTISWGLICTLCGLLNDLFSDDGEKKFSPGFYVMLTLFLVDLILLGNVELSKTKKSSNICKDVCTILSSFELMSFAFGAFIIGSMTSVIAIYEFLFLSDMGASQTLLGLTIFMQCLVGEVPLLFVSGWLIKKFGYFLCLASAFAGFTLRLGLYSILKNPWLALPIDILHGFTFAVFYATMTSFASAKAPPGLEGTTLGFLGGLYDGLGFGIGSFVGGIGFERLGGRGMFFVASMVSLISFLTFAIIPAFLSKVSATNYYEPTKKDPADADNLKVECYALEVENHASK